MSDPGEVWVVIAWTHEDGEIMGVFATERAAERAIDALESGARDATPTWADGHEEDYEDYWLGFDAERFEVEQ